MNVAHKGAATLPPVCPGPKVYLGESHPNQTVAARSVVKTANQASRHFELVPVFPAEGYLNPAIFLTACAAVP